MKDWNKRSDWKAILVNYDDLIGSPVSDCTGLYCLQDTEVMALLALCEYLDWPTRWTSLIDTPIDRNAITVFASNLRMNLMNNCCCGDTLPPTAPRTAFVRVNADGYQETSDDGGQTWVVDTQSDYRFNSTQFAPFNPQTASPDCEAALNVLAQIQRAQSEYNAAWESGEGLAGLIAAVITFLQSIGYIGGPVAALLTALVSAICYAVFSIGRVAWNAAFSEQFWSELKCAIFNSINPAGTFNASEWGLLKANIDAQVGASIARIWTWNLVNAMGPVLLTNAASIPAFSEDTCEECVLQCNELVNFTGSLPLGVDIQAGVLTPGVGLVAEQVGNEKHARVVLNFDPPCLINRVYVKYYRAHEGAVSIEWRYKTDGTWRLYSGRGIPAAGEYSETVTGGDYTIEAIEFTNYSQGVGYNYDWHLIEVKVDHD